MTVVNCQDSLITSRTLSRWSLNERPRGRTPGAPKRRLHLLTLGSSSINHEWRHNHYTWRPVQKAGLIRLPSVTKPKAARTDPSRCTQQTSTLAAAKVQQEAGGCSHVSQETREGHWCYPQQIQAFEAFKISNQLNIVEIKDIHQTWREQLQAVSTTW